MEETESKDIPDIIKGILDSADRLDPTTGDAKAAFEDISASIAAQRAALAHAKP